MIPAAGRATRLPAASAGLPKALVPIAGRPLLDWLLERLSGAVSDVCVVVDEPEGPVPATIGRARHGLRIHYAAQPAPLGVGDAVLRAASHVSGPFAAVMGDVFYNHPLDEYVAAWRASDADGAVLVEPLRAGVEGPVGLVEAAGDRVRAVRKGIPGPGERTALAGLAILPASTFEARGRVRPGETGELELETIIAWLMAEREARFVALPYEGWRRNINTEADLEATSRHLEAMADAEEARSGA